MDKNLLKTLIDEAQKLETKIWNSIKFKVLPKKRVMQLNLEIENYPKINLDDAMIKGLNLQRQDLIMVYRDYQKTRSPYWAYRIVS